MCRLLLKTHIGEEKEKRIAFSRALFRMKRGGPDSSQVVIINDIAFGHNRLAIIDPRSVSDQPMTRGWGTILFNGEIYNFKELKEKHHLQTTTNSDTEVILLLYNKYGDSAFDLLDGEFAIVIFDQEKNLISFVRDRLGIKPLYYRIKGTELIVSSEIKGISAILLSHLEVNRQMVDEWMCYGYTSGEQTMFNDVYKVLPGMVMTFGVNSGKLESRPLLWPTTQKGSLFDTLDRSVKKRMMSDVPISCTLSGGIDSSIIAYLMSTHSDQPIKTYTIGFAGFTNEFDQAKKVAKFIGAKHTEIEIPIRLGGNEIDEILDTMEEPIDRGSLIPTYFLSKIIKEKVTLIGEGADEVFGGYSRHRWLADNDVPFGVYFESQLRSFPSKHQPRIEDTELKDKNSALLFDLQTEIPNYHTLRIDKCFMNNGIEARVPFLDPEVVSGYLYSPYEWKQKPEKKILREAFKGILPDWITDQPKKALKFPFKRLISPVLGLRYIRDVIYSKSDILPITESQIDQLYSEIETRKNAARDLWNIFLFKKWEQIDI